MPNVGTEIETLRQQLAESQAREVKLREALDAVQQVADRSDGIAGWHMNGDIVSWGSILPEIDDALTLQTDDTALREMMRLAGDVMRERILTHLDNKDVERTNYCMNVYEEGEQYKFEAIAELRVIPGVTLEDLK